MREELKTLVDEFNLHRFQVTDHSVIQAKELRSLRKAILGIAIKNELTNEEWTSIVDIIFADDEWWVTG